MSVDEGLVFVRNPDGALSGFGSSRPLSPARAPPAPPSSSASFRRINCHRCRVLLEYRGNASFVQCPQCRTFNAVAQASQASQMLSMDLPPSNSSRAMQMLCVVCGTTNQAPWGVTFVRCGCCSTVSDVSAAYRRVR